MIVLIPATCCSAMTSIPSRMARRSARPWSSSCCDLLLSQSSASSSSLGPSPPIGIASLSAASSSSTLVSSPPICRPRIATSAARASSRRPCWTSQRGDSGSAKRKMTTRTSAGSAASPIDTRHSGLPSDARTAFTSPARTWPNTTKKISSVRSVPRSRAGATSATYTGTAMVESPQPRPMATRPARSHAYETVRAVVCGAEATRSDPTKKATPATTTVPRRPTRAFVERAPSAATPATAVVMATATAYSTPVSPRSPLHHAIAALTTPVSYPNRKNAHDAASATPTAVRALCSASVVPGGGAAATRSCCM
mmetsp:Transcript_3764/g.14844  ORF Transcript_3764/g.14844 Transcript_3764/m.14844 type:complete len:311 (-) Transcript_3764:18-950(-)